MEVWLPREEGVNSGIWTHYRYCTEIRGRNEKGEKYRFGAIYGLKAPDVDASKPARTWQTLDITFRNARFDHSGEKTENARITVQNENVLSIERTVNTDVFGEVLISELPSGSYRYRVTAANHQEESGRFWIKPGLTDTQDVFLDYNQLLLKSMLEH